ncbi:MAG: methyltransferase domain-containing protein [Candidatus Bathyarchaeota archaeon]|nr:MAG: methyltransferase domain-containing protein [Candidatus Bathyarchaeota archaeon]UCE57950.1 MAG: methyltransferase domain-containing protein [Candidatus Bathyarchaeota archaeon]
MENQEDHLENRDLLPREQPTWLRPTKTIKANIQVPEKARGEQSLFIAPFVASPTPVVRQMLILSDLKPGETLYDLGSGDGRAIIMAAKDFGAKSVGVELREDLVKRALGNINELGLETKAKILQDDMFKIDLTQADVVFLYLTTSANEKVKPKLETELKPGARIVSHDYEVLGWKPYRIDNFCENPRLGYPSHTLYVYKR